MANKSARQAAILEIIGAQVIGSQEELRHRLARRGVAVTQATLSRDLRELGLVRVPTADGARYLRQEAISDEAKPSLEALLPQLFSSVSRNRFARYTPPASGLTTTGLTRSLRWPK